MASTLIRSGTIVTAEKTRTADLLIRDEKIAAIGEGLSPQGAQVIDASGKLLMPGGIDPHCHFALPMFDTISSDDQYTGHKAAAFGGTTTVMDFVPQDFPTLRQAVEAWHAKADELAAVDFGFHMNITRVDESVLEEIPSLRGLGITTLKMFTAYNGRLRLQDAEIFQVMRVAAEEGMLPMLHAENGDVIEVLTREALDQGHVAPEWHALTRPTWGAVESILRGIALSQQAGARLYVVHVNTAGGLDQIRYGRGKGIPVIGETCPQYLFFTIDDLRREDGAKWICSPPVRSAEDNQALTQGLVDGSLQVFATDHCPFFFDGTRAIEYEGKRVAIPGKELGASDFTKIPNGLPGVGDRMPILWTKGVGEGLLSPNQFVALTSTNAAKIFGLYPQKGSLEPGADADVVIWDPERQLTYGVGHAQHRTDYNLYEGWELTGYPEKIFLRGRLIVDHERWLGEAGMGRFLDRRGDCETI